MSTNFNRHSSRTREIKPREEWVMSRVPAVITGAEWEQFHRASPGVMLEQARQRATEAEGRSRVWCS